MLKHTWVRIKRNTRLAYSSRSMGHAFSVHRFILLTLTRSETRTTAEEMVIASILSGLFRLKIKTESSYLSRQELYMVHRYMVTSYSCTCYFLEVLKEWNGGITQGSLGPCMAAVLPNIAHGRTLSLENVVFTPFFFHG